MTSPPRGFVMNHGVIHHNLKFSFYIASAVKNKKTTMIAPKWSPKCPCRTLIFLPFVIRTCHRLQTCPFLMKTIQIHHEYQQKRMDVHQFTQEEWKLQCLTNNSIDFVMEAACFHHILACPVETTESDETAHHNPCARNT